MSDLKRRFKRKVNKLIDVISGHATEDLVRLATFLYSTGPSTPFQLFMQSQQPGFGITVVLDQFDAYIEGDRADVPALFRLDGNTVVSGVDVPTGQVDDFRAAVAARTTYEADTGGDAQEDALCGLLLYVNENGLPAPV